MTRGEAKEDAISRQALKDALVHDWAFHFPQTEYNERKGYRKREREISTVIENMPPVIPSRPTGHWIKHENNTAGICMKVSWECSECHVWLGCEYFVRRSYCPNCGAKMESEGAE